MMNQSNNDNVINKLYTNQLLAKVPFFTLWENQETSGFLLSGGKKGAVA